MPQQTTGRYPISFPGEDETIEWGDIRDNSQSISDALQSATHDAEAAAAVAARAALTYTLLSAGS